METLGDKKPPKTSYNYYCEICDYKCSKVFNWDRHIITSKHTKRMSESQTVTKNEQKEQNEPEHFTKLYRCDCCHKIYNSRNGLWKHKLKCKIDNGKINELIKQPTNTENEAKELIQYLMKENSEFKQLIIEQNKQMIELAKNSGNNNNNTTNNNFNLNFFLNETCKNAMNIMDFVNQLNVSTNDLEETGRLGFAEGISKIFINGLKNIDIPDRPIHCSDFKRETIYIKDDNQWNKESDDKIVLTKAIKHVAHKNMKQISEWTKTHPEYNDSDSRQNDKYLKIVRESMSGSSQEETNKNYNKIIKNIVKETVINK
jgi:hypothetical protein